MDFFQYPKQCIIQNQGNQIIVHQGFLFQNLGNRKNQFLLIVRALIKSFLSILSKILMSHQHIFT